ncbi:uncharacterized protein [Hyperolius riggenbachi]|uniref:uncharacterized protein n=1 Tax=Hyperolius riggenbachi TaxID=752182 RepID=UPI0035A38CF7
MRWKMDVFVRVLLVSCLSYGITGNFLIYHEQKSVCIIGSKVVTVGRCNVTHRSQQWKWTEDGKLLHFKSSMCLSSNLSSPLHFRPAILTDCSKAPEWTCHENEGLLELANSSLFLRKQGLRAVVKLGRKYPNTWKRLEVDERGDLAYENICMRKDLKYTTVSPTTEKILLTTSAPHLLITNRTELYQTNVTQVTWETSTSSRHLNEDLLSTEGQPTTATSTVGIATTTPAYLNSIEEKIVPQSFAYHCWVSFEKGASAICVERMPP